MTFGEFLGRLTRGFVVGAALVALVIIAVHSGFESQTLGGAIRIKDKAILAFIAVGGGLGAVLNLFVPFVR